MKLEVTSDESVLALSGAAAGVYAAQFGLPPRHTQETFFDSSEPFSDVAHRSSGMCMAGLSAVELSVAAAEGSRRAKKNALKAAGCMWLGKAALDAHNVSTGAARQDTTAAAAVVNIALCLWRGFAKDGGSPGAVAVASTAKGKSKRTSGDDALLVG